jgi:hypothetical protein
MTPLRLPPHVQVAHYDKDQPPRYAGNKLIEALPPCLTEEELYASLEFLPPFDPACRNNDRHERLRDLLSLTNIMVPLSSHLQLAFMLDSMMRDGYIGRSPMTAEHIGIYQEIHEDEQRPRAFQQTYNTLTPKLSTALIGVSGMGKSTTVQRCLARYPRVIYHPELDQYQIPWLHFEMPGDGKGVKALLSSIIEAIAELIPDNTYYEDYVKRSRESESSMQSSVRRLLNKHHVGLLIPDEIQNVANTRKSDQVVMTELTTLGNKSKAPILFIGTPKADKVLGADFRQGRRSVGLGLGDWGPLPRNDYVIDRDGQVTEKQGEWADLVSELWARTLCKTAAELTSSMLDCLYYCTQGIIDLAIKLLIVAQGRAILDGTEQLSEQLLLDVYNEHFTLIHPMVEALRNGDEEALMRFEDIKRIEPATMLDDLARRYRGVRNRAATVRPGAPDFVARLTEAGKILGLPAEDASKVANDIAEEGRAKDMLDAAAQLARKFAPPKTSAGKPKGKKDVAAPFPVYAGIDDRPDDFRHAVVAAAKERTSVAPQLVRLGMLRDAEELICLG